MERLGALATGQKSDRIPVFCNLLDQGARELGMSLKEYYSKGKNVAEGQLLLREKFGHDNLWSLFYVSREAELLGCEEIIYSDHGPPNLGHHVIQHPEDIEKLEIPDDITQIPKFHEQLECLRILKQEAGGKYPVCAFLSASMSLPAILMGIENWMHLLMNGPFTLRDELLAKCSDFFRKQLPVYRENGADIVVYANPFGTMDIVSERIFRDISVPWMVKDLDGSNIQGIVYFGGGARISPVIDTVIQKTGIQVYHLNPLENITEAKKAINGRGLCVGPINDIKLIDWSEEEIRNEVKRIMEEGMQGGGFLFGSLVMPLMIPEENIKTMLNAAYEFGSY